MIRQFLVHKKKLCTCGSRSFFISLRLHAPKGVTWIGDQYYEHPVTYNPTALEAQRAYKIEGITRKLPLPTPNIDPERPDEQLQDHFYEHIIQNGQTTLGYLWKALKPLGIVSDAKALHNRLFYFYSSKAFAFRRLPLIYEQRTPQNWTDRTWILKLNEHISAADHREFLEIHRQRIEDFPLIDPTADATVMWYYRVPDDCGLPNGEIEGPFTTAELLQMHANKHIDNDTRCFSFRTEALCWMPFRKYSQLISRVGEFPAEPDNMKLEPMKYHENKKRRVVEYVRKLEESKQGIPNYLEHLGYEVDPHDLGIAEDVQANGEAW